MEQEIDIAFAELGLPPGASEPQVKAAWRRLVSKWHPDRNDSAAAVAKMQRINRAVEAIRRAGFRMPHEHGAGPAPDAPSSRHRDEPGAGPAAAASDAGSNDGATAAGKGAPGTSQSSGVSGRTIHRKVRLTLEEAAFGCTKILKGRVTQVCERCEGAGHRVLGGHCAQCHGSGATRERSWFGWMGPETACDACHGGGIAKQLCTACEGTGKKAARSYQVAVRFPHGVRDGDLLAVPAHPGKAGSPPAELSIRIEIQDSGVFMLEPDGTLRCEVMVDGFAWIANHEVEVPVLGGSQRLSLPPGCLQHRLPGKGFPVARRGARGDQHITLVPVFPSRLTADQQILLDQLIASTSGPKAGAQDERLQRWGQSLRAWKRAPRAKEKA